MIPRDIIRHPWRSILLLSLTLWASTIVLAQSGAGYDLTWFTVDTGGQTWSTGNGYTLGGAIGQPDAQAPAQGGGYRLQGGFWQPAAAPLDIRQYLPIILCSSGT